MSFGVSNFPTSLDATSNLGSLVNNVSTTLSADFDHTSDTTLSLTDGSDFPSTGGVVFVDGNRGVYTGKSGNDLTGVSGVSASASSGDDVELRYDSAHHNGLLDAILNLQDKVGIDSSAVATSLDKRVTDLENVTLVGGNGIDLTSSTFAVDLGTNPGLEFSSAKLQVKAGTGITLDASGVHVDVGTTASKIVQLDGSARLPAVDGSQLTNLPSGTTYTAGDGIDITSDVISVDLATNPGLEFSAAQLKAKAGTGISLDASGINVDVGTSANKIVQLDGSARLPAVDGSQLTNLPGGGGGKILQVLQTVKTDTQTISTSGAVDVTGLSQAITPTSTSNKVLVTAIVSVGGITTSGGTFHLFRDSTEISLGASAGSRKRCASYYVPYSSAGMDFLTIHYLDNPATSSSVTYKIQYQAPGSSKTVYINRHENDADAATSPRTVSSISLMEVEG